MFRPLMGIRKVVFTRGQLGIRVLYYYIFVMNVLQVVLHYALKKYSFHLLHGDAKPRAEQWKHLVFVFITLRILIFDFSSNL